MLICVLFLAIYMGDGGNLLQQPAVMKRPPWRGGAGGVRPNAGKQFSLLLLPALLCPVSISPLALSSEVDVDVFVDIVGRDLCIVVALANFLLFEYLVSVIGLDFNRTQVEPFLTAVPIVRPSAHIPPFRIVTITTTYQEN